MPKVAKAAKRPPENTAPLTIPLGHGRVATIAVGDAWPKLQLDLRTSDGVAVFQEGKWNPESNWWGGELERKAFLAPPEVALLRDQANKWVSDLCEGLKQAEQVRDAPPIALESWPTDGSGEKTALEVQPDQFVDLLRRQAPHSTNLRWDDADRLAILDVDWHGEKSPTTDDLDRLMREVSPSPFFVHRTRRGFHAGYLALEGFTAQELASAAAALMAREPLVATLGGAAEVKSETRHFGATHGPRSVPWRYPGQIEERVPDTHLRVLDELSHAQCSEDERTEIVARLGLTIGHRFDHRHCPLNPERSSASPNPVVASPNGVFCYSCESRGRGFVSWGELRHHNGMSGAKATHAQPLVDAVQHFASFVHVNLLMGHFAPSFSAKWRAPLYSCLLKRRHGTEDPRVPLALNRDWPIVRGEHHWLDKETLLSYAPRPDNRRFATFSSACVLKADAEGVLVAAPDNARLMTHAGSGSVPGYHPIARLAASPIWWIHRERRDTDRVLYLPPAKSPGTSVRYLPEKDRISFQASVTAIAARFKNINLEYLSLLFIARGYAEGSGQQIPIIWATGESKRGKTMTCNVLEALWDMSPPNLGKYAAIQAKERLEEYGTKQEAGGGFVVFDDCFKGHETKEGRVFVQSIATWILQLSAGRVHFHKLHVGSIEVPVVSPVLISEMERPLAFTQNKQLGRRIVMVPLDVETGDWDANGGGIMGWWQATPELRKAAESWYSWMVDEWFDGSGDGRSFLTDAKSLGYRTLYDFAATEDNGARDEAMRDLFYGVCTAKPDPRHAKRGPGYWHANILANTPASKALNELVLLSGATHVDARIVENIMREYQTGMENFLPVRCPMKPQIKEHGDKIFIRFRDRSADPTAHAKLINTELLKPDVSIESLKPTEPTP